MEARIKINDLNIQQLESLNPNVLAVIFGGQQKPNENTSLAYDTGYYIGVAWNYLFGD